MVGFYVVFGINTCSYFLRVDYPELYCFCRYADNHMQSATSANRYALAQTVGRS